MAATVISSAASLGMAILLVLVAFCAWALPRIIPAYDVHPSQADPSKSMSAVAYRTPGNSSTLQFYDKTHPMPKLRPDQILIKVKAAGLNPCDFKLRRNSDLPIFFRPLPKIPGEDVAGIVVQIGPSRRKGGNSKFQIGDRVVAMMPGLGSRWGALAEYAAVDEAFVAKIGDKTSFVEAASLPLVSLTALEAFEEIEKKACSSTNNETQQKKILIHAGAGGVGSFAIQYAKKVLNMQVATTASKRKKKFVRRLGADVVVDYENEDFEHVLVDYDFIMDTLNWAYESRTLPPKLNMGRNETQKHVLKRRGGHYLNMLSSDWSLTPNGKEKTNHGQSMINWLYYKIVNTVSPHKIEQYSLVVARPDGAKLQYIMDLVQNGTIKAVVDKTFPLENAATAFDYLEEGHASGKVVVTI